MNEIELIKNSKNGDLDSFNTLVLEYQTMAYNVAYRLLGNMAKAEDITQDSFISAYLKIKTFRGGSFKAWLMRIVTNASYDELRKIKRRPTIPLEPKNDEEEEIESPKWLIDLGESPEEYAVRIELSKAIQYCLDRLDIDFRKVVVFIDIQGMGYKEVSEIVNKPLGTIKSRLARARNKLKYCLQGFEELLPYSFRLNN